MSDDGIGVEAFAKKYLSDFTHTRHPVLCFGGKVRSVNDGQYHYISAAEVARRMGYNPAKCVLIDESNRKEKMCGRRLNDYQVFYASDTTEKRDRGI